MNSPATIQDALPIKTAVLWGATAAAAFHLAHGTDSLSFLICLFFYALVCLSFANSPRKAFYSGLAVGMACYAPPLGFFWTIFGPAAFVLLLVLAFWLGIFVLLARQCRHRFGHVTATLLLPFLWTGIEFFRNELYYLRFSWLSAGFAFADRPVGIAMHWIGLYGAGFLIMALAALIRLLRKQARIPAFALVFLSLSLAANFTNSPANQQAPAAAVKVAGVQLEFPTDGAVISALDRLVGRHPDAELLVLSEYTFAGPIPEVVKGWCKNNGRYLIVGGKEPAGAGDGLESKPTAFYNTAFVVGPSGEIAFRQVKSVPIQFFDDGLPAPSQALWDSPWGRIGLLVCYDLSYTRVVDRLVRLGAGAIIAPTMDVEDWGERQHRLHARVAPVRAAEHGIPIFRVCSSGISQLVDRRGRVLESAPFPGQDEIIAGTMELDRPGRLPLDRWLAPASTFVTAGTVLLLIVWPFIPALGTKRWRHPALLAESQ